MSTGEFDVRVKQLEGSLEKTESLLESVGQVLRAVEKAGNRVGRSRVPVLLVAVGTLLGAVVVFVISRRQDS
jgi:hypothetical protein